jgi:hypothetical protein
MPQSITYSGLEGSSYTLPSSRYYASPVIYWEGKMTYPIYRKKKFSFNVTDKHYEITKEMEYRPDKVSHRFFGTPDYWWKIMEVNGMKDILEFRAGRNIILPGGNLMF